MRLNTFIVAAGVFAPASMAAGQSATRDLPDSYRPGGPVVIVTVSLSGIGAITAAGVEDKPPGGWAVSNISNSGTFDAMSGKVKWGPFFSPSIPTVLTYELSPSTSSTSEACFTGTASFEGLDQPIGGELCIPAPIPAASAWSLLTLTLGLLTLGTICLKTKLLCGHSA